MNNLTIILSFLMLLGCSGTKKSYFFAKDKGLPQGTYWQGGADGGFFYYFEEVSTDTFFVEVFHDNTFDKYFRKYFKRTCNMKMKEVERNCEGTNGEDIFWNEKVKECLVEVKDSVR